MQAMKPYWFTRTIAGVTMDIGAILGMWNLYRSTAAAGRARHSARRSLRHEPGVVRHETNRTGHSDRCARLLRARHDEPGHSAVARQAGHAHRDGQDHLRRPPCRRRIARALEAGGPQGLHPRGLLVLPLAVRPPGQSRRGQVGAGLAGRRDARTTCRRCSARAASAPICRARATGAPTSGTTRITGMRARSSRSRSCRRSSGCSTRTPRTTPRCKKFITEHDTNHDGRVTKSELDKNGDGTVTADELPAELEGARRLAGVSRTARWAMAWSTCTTTARSPRRRWSASRPTCRTSARRSATGEAGSRRRRTTARRRASRSRCASRAARSSSEHKCSGCHGVYGNGRLTADAERVDELQRRVSFPQSAAAQLHARRLQEPHHAIGRAAARRGPVPHHHARHPQGTDHAGLGQSAGRSLHSRAGPLGSGGLHQDVLGPLQDRERPAADHDPVAAVQDRARRATGGAGRGTHRLPRAAVLGLPRCRRAGQRPVGGRTGGRLGGADPAVRLHQREVQVRRLAARTSIARSTPA